MLKRNMVGIAGHHGKSGGIRRLINWGSHDFLPRVCCKCAFGVLRNETGEGFPQICCKRGRRIL